MEKEKSFVYLNRKRNKNFPYSLPLWIPYVWHFWMWLPVVRLKIRAWRYTRLPVKQAPLRPGVRKTTMPGLSVTPRMTARDIVLSFLWNIHRVTGQRSQDQLPKNSCRTYSRRKTRPWITTRINDN